MNTNYKISYAFAQLPDTAIADFAEVVILALTNNESFPNLPVPVAALALNRSDYLAKLAATAQGGTEATADKNATRNVLETALRQTGAYVQSVASQDLVLLLSSGFQATSTNRTRSPLEKPILVGVDNSFNGKFVVRFQPVTNARAYEVQYKNGGDWLPAGIFTQARRIEINGLTPGSAYTVQVRAVGGSTGYSDWTATQPVFAT
jgi:hypothetical protein